MKCKFLAFILLVLLSGGSCYCAMDGTELEEQLEFEKIIKGNKEKQKRKELEKKRQEEEEGERKKSEAGKR